MSKDNKTKLRADHGQYSGNQQPKRSLLIRFIIFMSWVIGIGLLLSLVACQQAKVQGVTYEQR